MGNGGVQHASGVVSGQSPHEHGAQAAVEALVGLDLEQSMSVQDPSLVASRQATWVALLEQLHRERLAMPRIERANFQPFQASDAGRRGRRVIHNGIDRRPFRILKEIAAEQLAIGGQDANRSPGMSRERKDRGLKPILSQVVPIRKEKVGREPLGPPNPVKSGISDLTRMFGRFRLTNMSPFSAMPASSRCIVILVPILARR